MLTCSSLGLFTFTVDLFISTLYFAFNSNLFIYLFIFISNLNIQNGQNDNMFRFLTFLDIFYQNFTYYIKYFFLNNIVKSQLIF